MRPHHDGKAGRRSFAMRRLGAGQEDQAAAPSVVPSGLPFPDTWRYLSTTTTLWIPLECASHSPESHHYSPLSLDNRDFAPEHSWTINARAQQPSFRARILSISVQRSQSRRRRKRSKFSPKELEKYEGFFSKYPGSTFALYQQPEKGARYGAEDHQGPPRPD